VYGKYEDYKVRFISNNIIRALLDLPISINQDAFFEFTSVNDFIKILDYFINNKGQEKFYNIGNGERISLREIGRKIVDQSGNNPSVIIKKEGLNREYTCDSSLLRKEIPDLEFTPVEDGIKELFDYYRKNIRDIKKEDILFD
jgi:GDP-L-fucose synthase